MQNPTDRQTLTAADPASLATRYRAIRSFSHTLCEPLQPEDCVVQSMPDVSPTRWHLAHTTWFFETFVLSAAEPDYRPFEPGYEFLFNSYYNSVGAQYPRPQRGLLSRPTLSEVMQYRAAIDRRILALLDEADPQRQARLLEIVELGLQHEQQHQELMLTDIKHVFSCNPLFPVYRPSTPAANQTPEPLGWTTFEEGVFAFGDDGCGFAYDNERPRHRALLHRYELANRLVTCGEFCAFIDDGGYRRPELWLALGWDECRQQQWEAPLYWMRRGDRWWHFTLGGCREVDPDQPVCHVSYFEADAFARWRGARLPTELEWENAAAKVAVEGAFVESEAYHPQASAAPEGELAQMFGDVWQWTSSAYAPYPGYRADEGALGEYNGKFMCNQYVLRGGSCATSASHIRRTYRNFFPPEARWQFSGIRLAQ